MVSVAGDSHTLCWFLLFLPQHLPSSPAHAQVLFLLYCCCLVVKLVVSSCGWLKVSFPWLKLNKAAFCFGFNLFFKLVSAELPHLLCHCVIWALALLISLCCGWRAPSAVNKGWTKLSTDMGEGSRIVWWLSLVLSLCLCFSRALLQSLRLLSTRNEDDGVIWEQL